MSEAIKTCPECGETYPDTLEFFYRNMGKYLRTECKNCSKSHRNRKPEKHITVPAPRHMRPGDKVVVKSSLSRGRTLEEDGVVVYASSFGWATVRLRGRGYNESFWNDELQLIDLDELIAGGMEVRG